MTSIKDIPENPKNCWMIPYLGIRICKHCKPERENRFIGYSHTDFRDRMDGIHHCFYWKIKVFGKKPEIEYNCNDELDDVELIITKTGDVCPENIERIREE